MDVSRFEGIFSKDPVTAKGLIKVDAFSSLRKALQHLGGQNHFSD